MYSNQMVLAIGSLMLLSFIILGFYNSNATHISNSSNNDAVIIGSSIGMSIIEEISLKKFDHNVAAGTITPVSGLSTTMGAETGESIIYQFNDIDDYNNYIKINYDSNLGAFSITIKVSYVDMSNPNVPISSKRYHKRIAVKVENEYLSSPLNLYHIISY